MKLVPLGANVVVRRLPARETAAGGIVLPDNVKEKSRQGRVLSVGDGRLLPNGTRAPHQVGEGDRVLLADWAGAEVKVNGEELLIVAEDDILAVIP